MINLDAEVTGYIHRGIEKIELSDEGHLIITLTDGTTYDLGRVRGEKGETGEKGDMGEIPVYILEWHDGADSGGVVHPTDEEKQANIDTIKKVRSLEAGAYILYLKLDGGKLLRADTIRDDRFMFECTFLDPYDADGLLSAYKIFYSPFEITGDYKQTYSREIVEYVERKLGEYLEIDSEVLL